MVLGAQVVVCLTWAQFVVVELPLSPDLLAGVIVRLSALFPMVIGFLRSVVAAFVQNLAVVG